MTRTFNQLASAHLEVVEGLFAFLASRVDPARRMEIPGVFHPQISVHTSSGKTLMIQVDLPEHTRQKRALMYRVGTDVAKAGHNIEAVFIVTEAWGVLLERGEKTAVAPIDHPRREEILTLTGGNLTGQAVTCNWPILRSPQRITLGPRRVQFTPPTHDHILGGFLDGYKSALEMVG